MKGIHYITDDTGKRTAVILDLDEWGDVWEDIYDALVSESRKKEPRIAWEDLKAETGEEEKPRQV